MARFKIFNTDVGKRVTVKKASGFKGSLFSVTTSDFKTTEKNFEAMDEALQHALAAALYDEAVKIMNKSQKLVPVGPGKVRGGKFIAGGELKRSARVAAPKTLKRPESNLSYNTVYALRQHEEHSSKSKYLERPILASQRGLKRRLNTGIKKHLKAKTKVGELSDKEYG